MRKKRFVCRSIGFIPFFWAILTMAGEIAGTLGVDTRLDPSGNPWRITGDLVVPGGVTLTLDAGTVLFFSLGAGIRIEGGRLWAVGSEEKRILMDLEPGFSGAWNGIEFIDTRAENALVCVDMRKGEGRSNWIRISRSRVLLEQMTWESTVKTILEVQHPSVVVRRCVFPSVGNVETIHGQDLEGDEYFILEGNTFGSTLGYNDVIDFSNCHRPGPILEVYDNLFFGGADDALDLDGCDAHVEGNVFQNFHKGHTGSSTSNAIATGVFEGRASEIVVARNLFVDCDHGVLIKEGSWLVSQNNTYVRMKNAAVNFSEWPDRDVAPGRGARFEGDLFWEVSLVFENLSSQPGYADPTVSANRCLLPVAYHGLGSDNWEADPLFVDPLSDFRLLPMSPIHGLGPNGLDIGYDVPPGITLGGFTEASCCDSTVALTVYGPGQVAYQYAFDDSTEWFGSFDIETYPTIRLTGLRGGETHTVFIRSMNSAGRWREKVRSFSFHVTTQSDVPLLSESRDSSSPNLLTRFPNPFNTRMTIVLSVPGHGLGKLVIEDLLGRRVRTLHQGFFEEGTYRFSWDGHDENGFSLPSGTYFVRFLFGTQQVVLKILKVD